MKLLALFAVLLAAVIAIGCRSLTPYPALDTDDDTCDADAGPCESADASMD